MTIKHKIYNNYLSLINGKIAMLQQTLADLKESGTNETKSTAGDKHETALAMLQIEQANTRAQLQNALEDAAILQNINPAIVADHIVNGSVIKTGKGYFFMSVALGKYVIDSIIVYALSPQSPLGEKLIGLKVGEKGIVNGNEYLVEDIL